MTLNSADEFAFKEGDPIIYKGFKVGEFEDIYFNIEERVVYYNAFIEAPYHKLITKHPLLECQWCTFRIIGNRCRY